MDEIKYGYNVEKDNVDELNFPWKKNCFRFFAWFTTLESQKLEFTRIQVRSDNSNPVLYTLQKKKKKKKKKIIIKK